MTAAFWFQLSVAGLLTLLAVLGAHEAMRYQRLFDDETLAGPAFLRPDSMVAPALSAALAAALGAVAFGLRRGSRLAHRLSIAGLTLPLLVAALSVLGLGATYATVVSTSADAVKFYGRLDEIAPSPGVNAVSWAAGAALLVLLVATAGLLITRTSRRFFSRP